MSGSTTRPHRSRLPWLIPAIIAALSFIGGVAGNLVATDLDQPLKRYRIEVWVVFGIALVLAVIGAVWQARKPDEASEAEGGADEPERKPDHDIRSKVVIAEGEGEAVVVRIPPAANALHQLPPPPRDFTGRKEELGELRSHIERGGVTISGLHGLGGIGKTTLALKLAEELKPRYPDAQFYLDLKGVSSKPLTVAEALAHVVRAYYPTAKLPEGEAELRALYISVLEGKRALLLMDNAEGREQVEPLIPPDPCVLLVTSRKHFTLPGVFTKNLDIMSPEESRELLLKIAPRIGDQADEIAKLCGHLPLALRLAASALAERRDLSPKDYVRRLSDAPRRLKALGEVEPSLGLSYDLLGEDLQKLWRALAVFPAPFDARAAAAVWQLEQDAAQDKLGDLLKYSLLDWDDGISRYSLHDLARLFADSRLSDEERNAGRMRHAEHYLRVLAECQELYLRGGEAIKDGLARFDAERRNVEAGQEWACQQSGANETAARLCNQYPDTGVYVLSLRQHPRDEFIVWLEAALAAARQLSDRAAEGRHLGNLGNAYADLGEIRRAVEYHEQALIILREIGDRDGEGGALGNLGIAYKNLGEMRRAIEFHEQALTISREIGKRRADGENLGNLGIAYAALGETRRAVEFLEQALIVFREIGDRYGEGNALGNLGSAYTDLGETQRAIEFLEQRLVIAREIGDRRGEGRALGNLGIAYAALGETRRAVEFYEQALAIDREIGDRHGEGIDLFNTSLALDKLGDRARAIVHAEAALEIFEQIESPYAERVRARLAQWREEA